MEQGNHCILCDLSSVAYVICVPLKMFLYLEEIFKSSAEKRKLPSTFVLRTLRSSFNLSGTTTQGSSGFVDLVQKRISGLVRMKLSWF